MMDPEKEPPVAESKEEVAAVSAEAYGVDQAKLLRRIDLRLLPVICVLYLLAFLDRVNISNAVIYGLETDLHLKKVEYTALTIFFVPYIVAEIPANILMKRLRPHVWLAACMFGFGVVTMLQGFVQGYAGLLATRFFLGFFEAGMFPGCFYLLSTWYRREEAQKRYSFFFSSTSLAGAFGGLLATAIGKLDGKGGQAGWRWIFILEGLLTALVALASYFIIPDFPEESALLSEAERAFIKARLEDDTGASGRDTPMTVRSVLAVFKDYKVFLGAFMYFGLVVPAYGFAYFAPTIIKTFHYSATQTQLHSVPPWACSFVFSMALAFASDASRRRFAFTLIPIAVALAGFAMLLGLGTHHAHARYAALFLIAMGSYGAMPVIVCWFGTNLRGHHNRAVGMAWQVGFGNIGGIIATYSFLNEDAPLYTMGYSLGLAFVALSGASCVAYYFAVRRENRLLDAQAAQAGAGGEEGAGASEGRSSAAFRYVT